jgi:hypothetical protein
MPVIIALRSTLHHIVPLSTGPTWQCSAAPLFNQACELTNSSDRPAQHQRDTCGIPSHVNLRPGPGCGPGRTDATSTLCSSSTSTRKFRFQIPPSSEDSMDADACIGPRITSIASTSHPPALWYRTLRHRPLPMCKACCSFIVCWERYLLT